MNASELIQRMADRMPWSVGSLALYKLKMPRGRGWENTIKKLLDPDPSVADKSAELGEALIEHLLSGEKLIALYDADRRMINLLHDRAGALKSGVSASEGFPVFLDGPGLLAASPGSKLIAIVDEPNGRSIVFSSVRTKSLREQIAPTAGQSSSGYDAIVGIRRIPFQAFDVVHLPANGTKVETRMDFPLGMSLEDTEVAQLGLRQAFRERFGTDPFGQPANLFPLIQLMYDDPDEGTVAELAFTTTTGSAKHEKMRRRSEDLRTEKYHEGGKAALTTPLELHRVAIQWNRPIDKIRSSSPELDLIGSVSSAATGSGTLWSATIRKSVGLDDYSFVISRMLNHL